MKIIVGLGNPGKAYAGTRHNAGFQCVERISRHVGIPVSERRPAALLGQGTLAGEKVVLVKPRTFMNSSGEAISYLVSRFSTPCEDLLVIYDDMDLPLGKIRIRPSGSSGGHRGIRSIISALDSRDFPRIRIGVGRPPDGMDEVEYVLSPFTAEERPVIEGAIATAQDAVMDILEKGLDWAMNRYN